MLRILVLADGTIVERGTHSALLGRDGFYRRPDDLPRRVRIAEGAAVASALPEPGRHDVKVNTDLAAAGEGE